MKNLPRYQVPKKLTLVDACLLGRAAPSNFEDFVEHWHTHETAVSLHGTLGLSDRAYGLFLQHSDRILEEVLACRRAGVDFDRVWTPGKVPNLLALTKEIGEAKAALHNQVFLSDARTHAMLEELGEMIYRKNEITGLRESLDFLYLDNGEYLYHVAGFIGDETMLVDNTGLPLLVGDTVVLQSGRKHMAILGKDGSPMPQQEWLLQQGAVKKDSCWNLNMDTSFCAAFAVRHENCLDWYRRSLQREPPAMGGMGMPQQG